MVRGQRGVVSILKVLPRYLSLILTCQLAAGLLEETVSFRHIGIRDGLSQSSALCFLQDSEGFIWIGTFDGLNRYDGRHFKVFTTDSNNPLTISDNSVTSLLAEGDHQLWVGTNHGLNRFDRRRGIFIRYLHQQGKPQTLDNDQIWELYRDRAGVMWVATDSGLCRYDAKSDSFQRFGFGATTASGKPYPLLSLVEDSRGQLWVGSWGGGLFRVDREGRRLNHVSFEGEAEPFGEAITSLICDRHGDLWIGSMESGLSRFDSRSGQITHYRHDPADTNSLGDDHVVRILEDSSGSLWIGTSSGGLNRFDPLRGGFVRFVHREDHIGSLSNDSVQSLFEDKEGALWVGTFIGGANRYKKNNVSFSILDKEVTGGEKVWAIAEDDAQTLWIGAENGLFHYDPASGAKEAFGGPDKRGGLPRTTVWSLFLARDKRLWMGTESGLAVHDPSTHKITLYTQPTDGSNGLSSNQVLNVFEDGRGNIWASTTNDGLCRLDPNGHFTVFNHNPQVSNSLSNDKARLVVEDNAGVLWIGTQGGGLNRFDGLSGFTHYRHLPEKPDSLPHDHVVVMVGDRRDQNLLWLGTAGGLGLLDKSSGSCRVWKTRQGLPNDYIYALSQDIRGLIWLSCNRGLAVFDPKNERFRGFDVRDGLPSNEFNALACAKTRDERMLFGSIEGVVSFFPRDFTANTTPTPIVFSDFLVGNKVVNTREIDPDSPLDAAIGHVSSIVLNQDQRMVGFDFSCLEFTAPWQCRYEYRMNGLDKDWVATGSDNTRATYTNLSPGDYLFRVKATNADGFWNPDELQLRLTVLAPLWLRPWAKVIYLLIGIFLVVIYGNLQHGRLRRQRLIAEQERKLKEQAQLMAEKDRATAIRLEQQVKERTSALITQEKMATLGMLSSGVAHELNNPNNFVFGGSQNLEMLLNDLKGLIGSKWGYEAGDPEMAQLWEYLEDMGEQLELVFRGSSRIRDVVTHMEQFVRKGEALTRVNLIEGLESTITLVRSQYPEVLFEISGERELYCLVRPGELNQVFLNLVLNACEAIVRRRCTMPGAPARLRIDAERFSERAEMRFEDTGDGFSEEQGRHLFEAFYTTKVGGRAAGLGLYTAWQIVHEHGGTLAASSVLGQGSVFTLTLPVMREL